VLCCAAAAAAAALCVPRPLPLASPPPKVLVMSLWDDHDVNMLWLDSTYPPTTAVPPPAGAARGPCSPTSGKPSDVEKDYPSSYVT
jgi:hypothetical protein